MSDEITSVVNPQWINAPYQLSYLVSAPYCRNWSRKRRLKVIRRWRRKQERDAKLMRLITASMVKTCQTIETRILGMALAAGPRLFAPRPFRVEPVIRAVSGTPPLFLDLL